jgi:hypothetical protein
MCAGGTVPYRSPSFSWRQVFADRILASSKACRPSGGFLRALAGELKYPKQRLSGLNSIRIKYIMSRRTSNARARAVRAPQPLRVSAITAAHINHETACVKPYCWRLSSLPLRDFHTRSHPKYSAGAGASMVVRFATGSGYGVMAWASFHRAGRRAAQTDLPSGERPRTGRCFPCP